MYPDSMEQQNIKLLNSENIGDFADVEDFKIHYYEIGEGSPLLLIHNVGQSIYTWHRCIHGLSRQYHIYALDMPGSGYSIHPSDANFSVENMAQIIVKFLDKVGIKKCEAVSIGMGAIYTLRAAQLHPARFGKIALISPGGLCPNTPFYVRALNNPILSWLYKFMISPRVVENLLNSSFFDQTLVNKEMVKEYYAPFAKREIRDSTISALQSFDEEETMQALRELSHAIGVFWGADDIWHELEMAEPFQIALKNMELYVIRNCGHHVHEEKPEKFNKHLLGFLTKDLPDD